MKLLVYLCTQCVCTLHTHIWRTVRCKAEWQNPQRLSTPHYLRKSGSIFFNFCAKPQHIGPQLPQQSQHHTHLMELHYSNSCKQFSACIYSTHALTSNWFWVGPQAPQPFIAYQPTCTTLGLTHAHNHANRVSGVDTTSLWGAYSGVLSDTSTECVTQC